MPTISAENHRREVVSSEVGRLLKSLGGGAGRLKSYIQCMLKEGIREEEIEPMLGVNPGKLLNP